MALLSSRESDEHARVKALDVTRSFIVRSPAGSGKTQLLILRFLALLCNVQKDPEEVLAITFTRKAASEMRERILQALLKAKEEPLQNIDPLFLQTRQLALRVLARDTEEDWCLLANPNRLRIQTIDSFCGYLVKQMPISAHCSAATQIVEDASFLYAAAARETLNEIDCQEDWSLASEIEQLLLHFDNAHERIEKLLAAMLAKRDQWIDCLPQIKQADRVHLEEGLGYVVQTHLRQLALQFPAHYHIDVVTLLKYAAAQLPIDHSVHIFTQRDQFPTDTVEDYPAWLAIADFLLTKEGQWRKLLTKQQGFPAQNNTVAKEMKVKALNLLADLSTNELLRELLAELSFLPPLSYTDQQWVAVTGWLKIFPLLLAHLHLLFQREGVIDYVEIALNALKALGEADAPSDLALLLDQQIQHILVDEFQDTSLLQWHLLEKMVAGWQLDDGRTLFLVGDPMQSIYRFRKADVGLFLKAARQGIGSISLEPLTLHINFRSEAKLVYWTNTLFADLVSLPQASHVGAIKFVASIPKHSVANDQISVQWHPLFNADDELQAAKVVEIIRAIFSRELQAKIAILVRCRNHAQAILPLLRKEQIAYQAVELEQLESRPVILDLLALTRAFLNPLDRIAWLSVLRAPWCGLLLTDLYEIAGVETEKAIWERIINIHALSLSEDGHTRLAHFVAVMKQNLNQKGSLPLHTAIEKIWRELNGPLCLTDFNEQQNSKIFFDIFGKLELTHDIVDLSELEQRLAKQNATSIFAAHSPTVEIMTIHKAKGLEFDYVILPALERKTAADDAQLLLWSEYIGVSQQNYLILGPSRNTESKYDPVYRYLQYQEAEKAQHEMMRLFYVAVTRAKKSLHLVGSVKCQIDIKKPASQSFLGQAWPNIEVIFKQALAKNLRSQNVDNQAPEQLNHRLKRLKKSFFKFSDDWVFVHQSENNRNIKFTHKKQQLAQSVGTVIHQNFQYLNADFSSVMKYFEPTASRQTLLELGVSLDDVDQAVSLVERAIKNILVCTRGRWIFNQAHQDIHSEYPLNYLKKNQVVSCVIDRTFVDDHGVRWIIDFKTNIAPVENMADFLQYEKKIHQAQLERYANLMRKLDNRPICLGLYFPLQAAWIEWRFQ